MYGASDINILHYVRVGCRRGFAVVLELTHASGARPALPATTVAVGNASPASSGGMTGSQMPAGGGPVPGTVGAYQTGSAALTLDDILTDKDEFRRAAENSEFVQSLDADGIQKALGQIAVMRQGTQQTELEQLLLKKLARTDPAKALVAAMSVPNAHAAIELADPLFKDWLKKDATGAWAWANNLPDGLGRNRLLSDSLAAGAKTDPATSAAYILQISSQQGTEAIYRQAAKDVAAGLAKTDPAAMAKFLSQLPEGPAKAGALRAGADQIAKTDPKAAADLLAAARPSIDAGEGLASVLSEWGKKDMPSAIAYASVLPGNEETRAMTLLVPALARTDPKSAIDVASKLNDPQVTATLLYELPKDLKIETADQAIAAAAPMPDSIKFGFLENYAGDVVEKDPQSATRLLQQLPEGQVRNGALDSVVYALNRKDFATAQAYVNQVPAGSERDSGIATLINLSYHQPDRAMQLALGYYGDQIRSVQLPYLYSRWFKADPTAAQAWLSTAPLDAATRQKMTNPK